MATAQRAHAPKRIVRRFEAAGIELNGARPWDPQVHDPGLYVDLIRRGSLAREEGYVTYACLLQNLP
jgi:hypothetical protein